MIVLFQSRVEEQCRYCSCFYANWDEEVQEAMEQAPGEECSCGMDTFEITACPCFQLFAE